MGCFNTICNLSETSNVEHTDLVDFQDTLQDAQVQDGRSIEDLFTMTNRSLEGFAGRRLDGNPWQ